MAKRKTQEYIFADAYIGSFSKNLMNKKDYMRIATSRDVDNIETVLREFGYGEVPELREGNIENFIRREQGKLYKLIYDTIPDREELALHLLPFDYHNVKVCLKAELLGITPDENYLVSTGSMDWMKTVAMVRDRNYVFMPSHMKDGIIRATEFFGKSKDPQDIDIILDKACYKDMVERAEDSKEPFILGMVKTKIDLMNLNTFVRCKKMGKSWDFFKKTFIDGGYVSWELLADNFEENYGRIGEILEPYGYGEIMSEGAKNLQTTGDYTVFERMVADRLMEQNKKAKFQLFGIAPIAGYWFGKLVELDNLRIALTGNKFGFPPDEIEERLREPYV